MSHELSNTPPALACRLDALTPEERAQQKNTRARLERGTTAITEDDDGYTFHYADDVAPAMVMAWVALERKCCPFLRFTLEIPEEGGAVRLRVWGARGVKAFLAAAMNVGKGPGLSENEMALSVILKAFERADEVRDMDKGRFEIVHIGGLTIGRATYEPGWRWSTHVGPSVGASRCHVEHVGLVLSGTATAALDDGRVFGLHAGQLFYIPPVPHDSWVLGHERYVSLHFLGAGEYAKK